MEQANMENMEEIMSRVGCVVVQEAGEGGFGTVYEVKQTCGPNSGQRHAVKKIRKSDVNSLVNERIVHQRMPWSPCIPELHFEHETEENVYLFFEFIEGGTLFDRIYGSVSPMYEDQVKMWLERVALGIEELHRNKIIHRDIKLENIVLNGEGRPYIVDFGLAKIFEENQVEEAEGICGTMAYVSPEMIRGKYTYVTDWWSFGVCAYEIFVGEEPFANGENCDEIIKKSILEHELQWNKLQFLSKSCGDFLRRLLCKNPSKRLGANGVKEILNHPFMASKDSIGSPY